MSSPYQGLPPRSYWKTGVVEQDWSELYSKKFDITRKTQIMTAGSCFAQNIARYFARRRYKLVDTEPAPPGLSGDTAKAFGYGLYSARYGNIYTTRQLWQLTQEAFGLYEPANPVWTKNGRYFDALRPSVEPDGLESESEVLAQRRDHLECVRAVFTQADLCIFTFGLTEAWVHKQAGTVYPTAPGTIAGEFDPDIYEFKNFNYMEVLDDFIRFRDFLKKQRPDIKFLLTVSPVPLTATASASHVLPATVYSKSVLRAVAGQLAAEYGDVDYFPSYEMVATPFFETNTYEENLRTVRLSAIESVMQVFFQEHSAEALSERTEPKKTRKTAATKKDAEEDVICEEQLLEAFAER